MSTQKWYMHLSGCFSKGAQAARDGKTEKDCPYTARQGLSRQRMVYWLDGFRREMKQK